MKLTEKQKRFCDEYIISGKATDAAKKAGYSAKTARAIAHNTLVKPQVRAYVTSRLKELEDQKVADQQEVLQILTAHARRETTEYDLAKSGEVVETPTSVANSIRAAELLGKRYSLWSDRTEISSDVDLNIHIDYGEDDDD